MKTKTGTYSTYLTTMNNEKMAYQDFLRMCMENEELVAQYERLKGIKLQRNKSLSEMQPETIDIEQKKWMEFLDFCRDFIWKPVAYGLFHKN